MEEERLRALEQVVPEAFADGQINWEALRESLGERVEDEEAGTEHFGLFWPGKREARRLAAQPSKGTLVPAPSEGVDEETTENIFIEGDNLEVLKLLQKSYAGRIKMIYIDPPYNTGNDFIYKDNFAEPLEDYLKKTGQMGEEGELLTTNTKADGRFHTNWLSMMYPRLRLARNLLSTSGFLTVTINDNEAHHLRMILDEIFGSENFIASIVWQKTYVANMTAKFISDTHDYILVYARNADEAYTGKFDRTEEQIAKFQNPDNDPRGLWKAENLSAGKYYAAGQFTIITPAGREVNPPAGRYWRCNEKQYKRWLNDNRITFGKDGNGRPMLKKFLSEVGEGLTPDTWWGHKESGSNKEASIELKNLFDGDVVFDTPKPVKLLRRLLKLFAGNNSLIMDFFAGGGVTAQAVLEANRGDGGSRKFILVQLPEKIDNPKYPTIAEVIKERIRRNSRKIIAADSSRLPLGNDKLDQGFKVFKLSQSNFQAWQDYRDDDIRQLEILFASHETPFVEDWKEQDVLTELLLIEGFPLNSKITPDDTFIANRVMQVESDFSAHRLFVCLEPRINDKTIERVAELPREDIFICLDSSLTDAAKVRLTDVGNVRAI